MLIYPTSNILLDIIFSYTQPLTSLQLPKKPTGIPPDAIPTGFLSSHPVLTLVMNPRKTPTDDQSTVLPLQLYTYIYILRSSIPQNTYTPLYYSTSIMTLAHITTHSPHK